VPLRKIQEEIQAAVQFVDNQARADRLSEHQSLASNVNVTRIEVTDKDVFWVKGCLETLF